MAKKKFRVEIHRTYKCYYDYDANFIHEIENMINWNTGAESDVTDEMCNDFWEELDRQESEQMDVDIVNYKIWEDGKEQPWRQIKIK
tara:strand:- start:13030 stop:13290 length:261 start_codon:yes stop_codon:yes gene_type:complete